jgi:hypothetical protein
LLVFMFVLCKVPLIQKFNPNKIMEPFMKDMKQLEAVSI